MSRIPWVIGGVIHANRSKAVEETYRVGGQWCETGGDEHIRSRSRAVLQNLRGKLSQLERASVCEMPTQALKDAVLAKGVRSIEMEYICA
jgi:hypothetical protein